MTRSAVPLLLLGLAFAPSVLAQPNPAPKSAAGRPIETVIVTAPKFHVGITPGAIAHDFVKSFAAPTVLTEQISRWQDPVCPDFEGVAPQYAAVMDYRLRQIAIRAGAPMKEKGCKPNLFVVFTSQPQAYLDLLHKQNVDALGYHGATTITHPIQAWYVTGITDVRGQTVLDHDGMLALDSRPGGVFFASSNTARQTYVGGWRFHPDVASQLLYVTIIVDTGQTGHNSVEGIADYVAMMALSRTEDYDDCQLMPSITNLLSANCDDKRKPDAITASDIAYLKGVYKMDAGANLQVQQDQIAAEMQKTLGGQ